MIIDSNRRLSAALEGDITTDQLVIFATFQDLETNKYESKDFYTLNDTKVLVIPASDNSKKLEFLSIYNNDTVNAVVIIYIESLTFKTNILESESPSTTSDTEWTSKILLNCTLSIKDTLFYSDNKFYVLNSDGAIKQSS